MFPGPKSENLMDKKRMRVWQELLPGIEEFLSETLAAESLSEFAEQRRLYFLERLDIIKLPPTLPPRKGRVLNPDILKDTEVKSGIPANNNNNNSSSNSDFAATQREIARSWAGSTGHVHETPLATKRRSMDNDKNDDKNDEKNEDDDDDSKVKDYIDIDTAEIQKLRASPSRSRASTTNPYDDEEMNKDTSQAEIDALIRHGVALTSSHRSSLDLDGNARSGSHEDAGDDAAFRRADEDTNDHGGDDDDDDKENDYEIPVARQQLGSEDGGVVTPPLPKRGLKFSDSGSRNSVDAGDEVPPELPYRPPLPRRNEVYTRSGCSDKSDPDISGDGDSTSYETFDEDEGPTNEDLKGKLGIKLPRRAQKKKTGLKISKKSTKSRSLSIGEVNLPFRKLVNIGISGELYHKGKLSWNRRLVAITNGCLAMYKPDKEARPLLVIPLMGYEAAVDEREGKRGFEVKMTHPYDDTHHFSVDHKEWAFLWKEHINEVSRGRTPSRYHTHLARTTSGDFTAANSNMNGSKHCENVRPLSLVSDYDEIDFRGDNVFREEDEEEEEEGGKSADSAEWDDCTDSVSLTVSSGGKGSSSTSSSPTTSSRGGAFSLRDRTLSATINEILRRRKPPPAPAHHATKAQAAKTSAGNHVVAHHRTLSPTTSAPGAGVLQDPPRPGRPVKSASTLSLSRLDWKSVVYNWSTPLDQVIMTFRRTDLTGSNSNLSTGSGDGGTEEAARPRLRSGSKVMRMGSFAFRASQFFENIGRRSSTSKRKLSAQSSADSFVSNSKCHGGSADMQDGGCNGIVEESSLSSTSTGNVPSSALTPTSDLNNPVFSDTNSSSVPNSPSIVLLEGPLLALGRRDSQGQGRTNSDVDSTRGTDDVPNATHQGHLYIFSPFNRRRWGKRWCLVRNNMFECYRTSSSSQCEINFLLGSLTLKGADVETKSPLALMLLEADKEVITVEPVSEAEMHGWVQVLMAETATLFIPEGLEAYMKKPEPDEHSLLSFSVLKQWDMDLSSRHDYEEPGDASSSAKSESSISNEKSSDLHKEKLEEKPKDLSDLPILEALEKQQICEVKCSPSSTPQNKNKNTTDSGFYSVKGNNSDSDVEEADASQSTQISAQQCGYSVGRKEADSEIQTSTAQTNVKASADKAKSWATTSSDETAEQVADIDKAHSSHSTSCSETTAYCLAQSITISSHSPMSTNTTVASPHSNASSPSISQFSNLLQPCNPTSECSKVPSTFKDPCPGSPKDNHINLLTNSSQNDNQQEMILCEPDNKDDYTRVLKRSERSKSNTPENSVPSSEKPSKASSVSSEGDAGGDHKSLSCIGSHYSLQRERGRVSQDNLSNETDGNIESKPETTSHNLDSDYEAVTPQNSNFISFNQLPTSSSPNAATVEDEKDVSQAGGAAATELPNAEDDKNTRLQNSSPDSTKVTNSTTPAPTSQTPSTQDVNSKHNKCRNPSEAESKMEDLISSIASLQLQDSNSKSDDEILSDLLSDNQTTLWGQEDETSCSTSASASSSVPAAAVSPRPVMQSLKVSVDSNTGGVPGQEAPVSPSLINVSALINTPGVKEDELQKTLEKLKDKKSHLKRKRIAVHDKRQRVSSDEERLACEKEFACLERDAEAMDQDIGVLQNHLETLSGQSLEVFKTQTKKTGGSKKRRGKKH